MTGSIILDVAIGLFFIYLLLSLMCSALQELLASLMGLRSKNLQKGINNLLADPAISDIAGRVCAHPLIRKLAKEGKKPSYIPARTFTLALMETIKDPASVDGAFSEAKKSVEKLPEGESKKPLPLWFGMQRILQTRFAQILQSGLMVQWIVYPAGINVKPKYLCLPLPLG